LFVGVYHSAALPTKPISMETPTSAPRRVRRPQAERSATTRAKLIDAAIACLHRLGYASTTTSLVAEEAGVSRGAMMHQFPSKTALMLTVVRAVFERDSEHYKQSILTATPKAWMRSLADTVCEVVGRPSGIAVMEIMLASRSDPDLAGQLREIQLQIDREAHAWVLERHAAAGLKARPDSEALHRLFVAAARGLAMEELFMRNRGEIKKSIDALGEVLRYFYPEIDK
jgi:AcrR family transcriptional regulator